MAARSWSRAHPGTSWLRHLAYFRCNRRHRSIGPVVEALEGRMLLAGTSPTNPVPVAPRPTGAKPTPQQLGAAYVQVVTIQATTLQSLGNSDREVEAAGARLAGRTAVAIDGLTAELGTAKGQLQAGTINAAIRRDRHILNLGGCMPIRSSGDLRRPARSRIRRPIPPRSTSPTACSRPCRSSSRKPRPRARRSPAAAGGRPRPSSRSWITSAIN